MDVNRRLDSALVQIEEQLKANYPAAPGKKFEFNAAVTLARQDGRIDKREEDVCSDLWKVRNLLSHRTFGGQRPIVATAEGAVLAEQLLEQLGGPIPRIQQLAGRRNEVTTIAPDSTVRDAIQLMREHDYTCLPVVDATTGFHGLLSSHDLLLWIGGGLRDIGLVEDTLVGAVAREGGIDFHFVPRDLPQQDARRAFLTHADEHHQPLAALLITMTGKQHEPLLGILTPWDLPGLAG